MYNLKIIFNNNIFFPPCCGIIRVQLIDFAYDFVTFLLSNHDSVKQNDWKFIVENVCVCVRRC